MVGLFSYIVNSTLHKRLNNSVMDNSFLKMSDGSKVLLEQYVPKVVNTNPEVEVYIGCDSQNHGKTTVYVSTVLFRYKNNGAHVIYLKEKVERIYDMWARLWAELERSVKLALFLQNTCGINIKQIDMDYNQDPDYPSSKLYKAASGYAESMGFDARAKPELLMATWAANVLCH